MVTTATPPVAGTPVAPAAPPVPGVRSVLPHPPTLAAVVGGAARPDVVTRPVRRPLPGDREPGELDLAHRIALADRIAALVLDADRLHRGDTPPARASRAQIKDARGRLLDLDHALRSGIPITRRGERLIERLLAGVIVGTYVGHGPRALHDDAEAACLAIGSVTPFH